MASDLKKNSVTVFMLIKYKWLNGVQKPFIKYWKTGKELSSFVYKIIIIIVSYLCIHGKCNPWDYTTMRRDIRLFKGVSSAIQVTSYLATHSSTHFVNGYP